MQTVISANEYDLWCCRADIKRVVASVRQSYRDRFPAGHAVRELIKRKLIYIVTAVPGLIERSRKTLLVASENEGRIKRNEGGNGSRIYRGTSFALNAETKRALYSRDRDFLLTRSG